MGSVLSSLFGAGSDGIIDHEAIKNAGDVYSTDSIYYGDDGNLRFGRKPRDRQEEMKAFAADGVDDTVEENGKRWYIMDGPWMENWLAFLCASSEDFCLPDPGPCNNRRLLEHNATFDGWVARVGVEAASKTSGGDYRRVSEKAWALYCELYPGSGPAISLVTVLPTNEEDEEQEQQAKQMEGLMGETTKDTDPYSTALWEIEQKDYVPPENVKELLKAKRIGDEVNETIADSLDILRLRATGADSDDDNVGSDDEPVLAGFPDSDDDVDDDNKGRN